MRIRACRPLALAALLSILAPAAAADPVPALEEVLLQVDAALAAGGAEPRAVDHTLALLPVAAEADGRAPELVRHLVMQLQPLGSRAPATDEARRQELVRRVRSTLDALNRKLQGAAGAEGPQAAPATAPGNDSCAHATALIDGVVAGTNLGATNDGGASCGASDDAPDIWYSYTAASDGLVVWDTFGSGMDTVLSLHSACPDLGGDHELACSDDARGTIGSLVSRQMAAGETVWVRVSGAAGATGSFDLRTDSQPPGSIAGTVVKAGTGTPIEGAGVTLFDDTGFFFSSIVTPADGTYLFAGISSGSWYLSAGANLFESEIWEDRTCLGFCDPSEVGDPVVVTDGLVAGIDFDLAPAGSIEGRVTDAETGEPLFLFVDVFDANGNFVGGDSTDGMGTYRVTGLRPGTYTVQTNVFFGSFQDELFDDIPCHPFCDVQAGTPVVVTAGSTTPGIDFALDRLGSIQGTLTDAVDGTAISFQPVLVFDSAGSFRDSAFTDSLGEYRVEALSPGSYFVRTSVFSSWADELFDGIPCEPSCTVTTGTPIAVALATETGGVDFSLDRLGNIAGEVTAAESGDPVSTLLEVHREDGSLAFSTFVFGAFELGSLAPGDYFVSTDSSFTDPTREDQLFDGFGCDPACDVTAGTPVTVSSGVVTAGLDFALAPCSLPSHRSVTNLNLLGTQTHEACRTVGVGPNVTVGSTGRLVLRAGRAVVFHDGFRIQSGGRLAVTVDPDVGSP